ncbi:MAG TPA: DUF624 domain-containing protein [Arachnia sp.]|jgi:uncharacterized membrane protein YesL|nr:DUF624 domain-containing protein [Arachnia sp.]
MRVSHDTYQLVFGIAYLGLMTNAMLTIACLPLIALLALTDPAQTWPLIAAFAPLAGPALAAAFTVFRRYSDEGSVAVVRGFWKAWRATARRALTLGAATSAALVVLSVNLQVRAVGELSALTVPLLGVLAVLVVATCLTGLVAVAEAPDASLREIVTVSAVLGLRRWYLTAVSLVVLGSLAGFFFVKPALAIGLAAAPLLYVVWAGGRHTLKPAIVEELS